MPWPVNKDELITLAEHNFNELLELIDGLPENVKKRAYENNELNNWALKTIKALAFVSYI